jgi:uncharacterized protein YdaT
MANNKHQHVVPHNEGWAVQGGGNSRATVVRDTQQEAVNAARTIAQNQGCDVVIHGRNGRIRDRNSYGNDPYPPKG